MRLSSTSCDSTPRVGLGRIFRRPPQAGECDTLVTLENSNQDQILATDPPSTRKFEPVMNVA